MNLTEKLIGIVRTVKASIKPDKDSKESKQVYLAIDYSECDVNDLLTKSAAHDKIAWQNGGGGRKDYDNIVAGSTIKVKASRPGAAPEVDPITALIALAAAAKMSVEDYLKQETAKRLVK